MGNVVITVTSAGLDRIRVQEIVLGEVKREIEIDLAAIKPVHLKEAIGSVVLGRIAMRESGCFSGDFIETSHEFAEAMALTNHPELLFIAHASANSRASQMRDVAALDLAEAFLRASASQNYPPALEALEGWLVHKAAISKCWKDQSRSDES